jgi:hypothetical protein
MTTFGGWPIEASADDLRDAILLGIELGLVESDPALQFLVGELRTLLRLEQVADPRHLPRVLQRDPGAHEMLHRWPVDGR